MGPPSSRRHVGVPTPLGPGSDLDTFRLPDGIMPMSRADQSMSDLVQHGIDNRFPAITVHQVDGQLNGLLSIAAQAQRPLATVEGERPVVQAMLSDLLQGQTADLHPASVPSGNQGHQKPL
jgi:hypothetical protein